MSRERLLARLRSLPAERPTSKMGQVRWAWPEIQAARAAGHTLQRVHQRLHDAGIEIGYRTLSLYIGRLAREQQSGRGYGGAAAKQAKNAKSEGRSRTHVLAAAQAPADPFANIRRERERKRSAGFDYDAFSTNKNLLE
jgi:hypothetical protein